MISGDVFKANAGALMIGVRVVGAEEGVPGAVELTAEGNARLPASRVTVVRREGESGDELWSRVIEAIRALKMPRSVTHGVYAVCMHGPLPSAATFAQLDLYRNTWYGLWFEYYREKASDAQRIRALTKIVELVYGPPPVQPAATRH